MVVAATLEGQDIVQLLRVRLVIVVLRPAVVLVTRPRHVVPGIRRSTLVRQHGVQLVKSRRSGPGFESHVVQIHRIFRIGRPRGLLLRLVFLERGVRSLRGACSDLRGDLRLWIAF